jgi:hypothetical protein
MDFTTTTSTSSARDRQGPATPPPTTGIRTTTDATIITTKSTANKRPWRKARDIMRKEQELTKNVLTENSKLKSNLNTKAIVFCYEADRLLDTIPITEYHSVAQEAVQRFREAVTNDRSDDKAYVEVARVRAVTALKALGLEGPMRAALAVQTPGKWPVMHEVHNII